MPDLTSEQARELARTFLSLGQSIANYRMEKWDEQTDEERKHLSDQHWKIISYADDFVSLSTTLILDEAETELEKLQSVTKDIEQSIHKIEMVQKVINLAGAVVNVGFAILQKDPKKVGKEINELSKVWNEDLPSEKKKKESEEPPLV